jgi:hypothetical protein
MEIQAIKTIVITKENIEAAICQIGTSVLIFHMVYNHLVESQQLC